MNVNKKQKAIELYIQFEHCLMIINKCILNVKANHLASLDQQELDYFRKIEEGERQLTLLLHELGLIVNQEKIKEEGLPTIRHDMRLAINIIQGYSDILLETITERDIMFLSGNLNIIKTASQEILKCTTILV